jgi:hypothetical protein
VNSSSLVELGQLSFRQATDAQLYHKLRISRKFFFMDLTVQIKTDFFS